MIAFYVLAIYATVAQLRSVVEGLPQLFGASLKRSLLRSSYDRDAFILGDSRMAEL